MVSLCASASLLNIMDLDASFQVSRNLQIELGLLSDIDITNPDGTLATDLNATVGSVVDATVNATGDLGDTAGDTLDGVGGALGSVGGLLGG